MFKYSFEIDVSHFDFTLDKMYRLHLDETFDAADGGVEQRADSLVTVDAVSVSKAHEDDVRRKSRDEIDCYASRF